MALIEAGWRLGDRLLVLAAPQLRGDDVAELQGALNQLGFDCGRPDGIFGPATVRALEDFQRNGGLVPDGSLRSADDSHARVAPTSDRLGPGVASVAEALTEHASLITLRIVVGQFGGLSSITRSVTRALRTSGATVMSTDEYEAGAQAAAANRFGAHLYVGFEARADTRSLISYYAVPTFESIGGRALATRIAAGWCTAQLQRPEVRGMRLPVLRETRMPAVLCSLGPVRAAVDATDAVTDAVVGALTVWATGGSSPDF